MKFKGKTPADFRRRNDRNKSLEREPQAEPGDAIILRFVRPHCAGVEEHAHMRTEAIFHSTARLTKPKIGLIKLVAAATKDIGGESALAQRQAQHQIGRGAVYKSSGGVFGISLRTNPDVTGDEITEPRAGTEFCVLPDCPVGRMFNIVLTERSRPERING